MSLAPGTQPAMQNMTLRPATPTATAMGVNAAATSGPGGPGGAATTQGVQEAAAIQQQRTITPQPAAPQPQQAPQAPPPQAAPAPMPPQAPTKGFMPNSQGSVTYAPGQGPVTEQVPDINMMPEVHSQPTGIPGWPGGPSQGSQGLKRPITPAGPKVASTCVSVGLTPASLAGMATDSYKRPPAGVKPDKPGKNRKSKTQKTQEDTMKVSSLGKRAAVSCKRASIGGGALGALIGTLGNEAVSANDALLHSGPAGAAGSMAAAPMIGAGVGALANGRKGSIRGLLAGLGFNVGSNLGLAANDNPHAGALGGALGGLGGYLGGLYMTPDESEESKEKAAGIFWKDLAKPVPIASNIHDSAGGLGQIFLDAARTKEPRMLTRLFSSPARDYATVGRAIDRSYAPTKVNNPYLRSMLASMALRDMNPSRYTDSDAADPATPADEFESWRLTDEFEADEVAKEKAKSKAKPKAKKKTAAVKSALPSLEEIRNMLAPVKPVFEHSPEFTTAVSQRPITPQSILQSTLAGAKDQTAYDELLAEWRKAPVSQFSELAENPGASWGEFTKAPMDFAKKYPWPTGLGAASLVGLGGIGAYKAMRPKKKVKTLGLDDKQASMKFCCAYARLVNGG